MRTHGWPVAVILAVAVITGYPVLVHKMLPRGHDSIEHLQWYACFANQLWGGELFPRWLENMNAGLGSPSFFVYAPLPYYLAALLRPASRLLSLTDPENFELGTSAWFAIALSGVAAYHWLRSMATKWAATIGAVVYLAAPYHVSIDLYSRGAVPELWSFAWIPLTLYFASGVMRTRARTAMAGLMVSYALLLLTHLFTALLFTPVLLAYVLLLLNKEDRSRVLPRFAACLIVGMALSAVYVLPALEHEKNIPTSRLIELRETSRYQGHFLFADAAGGKDDFLRKVSWTTVTVAGAAVLAFFAASLAPGRRNRPERLWIVVALMSLVMMTPASDLLWRSIPTLAALQFPWRFNIPLTLAAAVLVALAASHASTAWRSLRGFAMAAVSAILLLWLVVDVRGAAYAAPWHPELTQLAVGDYLFPAWGKWTEPRLLSAEGIVEMSRMTAADPAHANDVFLNVSGSRSAEFSSQERENRWVTLRRFYYPGWTATTEAGIDLPLKPAPSTGLIDVQVPGGSHKIRLMLPWGPAEKLGLVITLLCLPIPIGLLSISRRSSDSTTPGSGEKGRDPR